MPPFLKVENWSFGMRFQRKIIIFGRKVIFAKYNSVDTLVIVKESGRLKLMKEASRFHFKRLKAMISAEMSKDHLYTIDNTSSLGLV